MKDRSIAMKPESVKSGATILVVEDAPDSREMIATFLEMEGLRVVTAASIAEMQRLFPACRPALVLMDVNLPDGNGIEAVREAHLREHAGVIFVTACDDDGDVLAGLEAGDDYVVKPVNLPMLAARIRSVLRRTAETVVTFDGWILDLVRREFFRPTGQMLELTSGEFNILAALAAHRPSPLSRDFLLDVISNRDPRDISTHTVDNLIARLRRKMHGEDATEPLIRTVRGVGYALVPIGM